MTDKIDFGFTNREKETIEYMKLGFSNKQIAKKMYASSHTIKIHIARIIEKTGTVNRTHAAYKLAICGYFKQSEQELEQFSKLH